MENEEIPNGERLQAFIKAHRIPVRKFAESYGVSTPTLYNSIFSKYHGPDSVSKISEIFQKDFDLSEQIVDGFRMAMQGNSSFDMPVKKSDLVTAMNNLTQAIVELTQKIDAR